MILEADYSQIEPRIFGYYCATGLGDDMVADWYREGRDLYYEIAGQVYGKPADEITKSERQQGKAWFLMSLYGAGPTKIARETGMNVSDAKKFYVQFHDALPQIKRLSNPTPKPGSRAWDFYTPGLVERQLKRKGYLTTPWGRHQHPEKFGEFKMLNRIIQGSAADYMKAALRRVARWQRERGVEGRMILTIHDSILADLPRDELEVWATEVPPLMVTPDEIAESITKVIPIEVGVEASFTSWADKRPLEEVLT